MNFFFLWRGFPVQVNRQMYTSLLSAFESSASSSSSLLVSAAAAADGMGSVEYVARVTRRHGSRNWRRRTTWRVRGERCSRPLPLLFSPFVFRMYKSRRVLICVSTSLAESKKNNTKTRVQSRRRITIPSYKVINLLMQHDN